MTDEPRRPRNILDILPDDVFAAIFEVAYLHHFPHCRLHDGLILDSPIAASHVCRRWRRVSLSLSSLWSCIHVMPHQGRHSARITETYLARSGLISPVSIVMGCLVTNFERRPDWDKVFDEFAITLWPPFETSWALLLAHKHRWKHCALASLHQEVTEQLLQSLKGSSLPLLEYFSVISYSEVDESLTSTALDVSAPALVHLRTDVVPMLSSPQDVFGKLTHFKLHNMTPNSIDVLRVLKIASATLVDITFANVHFVTEEAVSQISLPLVCRMTMQDVTESKRKSLSTSFVATVCNSAAALKDLYISSEGQLLQDIEETQLSFPTVETLQIILSPTQLLPLVFLHAFPAVTAVDIISMNFMHVSRPNPRYLHFAMQLGALRPAPFWPLLQTLKLTGIDDEATVTKFVGTRHRSGHPIKRLVLGKETYSLGRQALDLCAKIGVKVSYKDHFDEFMLYGQHNPIPPWDPVTDKPAFVPWENIRCSWEFDDQFPLRFE
ncbi:hypothetical protein PsYK624_098520 [Phanerochaete sordida]|uniref:F-box domain-containing protein n=1 Tax=Phanerochaete sordida TaxID=48140 RepID=A0A9P3GF62_9APHY|nr:hypothetical protein PsYK624_098520 [Phanerochaete sordida]